MEVDSFTLPSVSNPVSPVSPGQQYSAQTPRKAPSLDSHPSGELGNSSSGQPIGELSAPGTRTSESEVLTDSIQENFSDHQSAVFLEFDESWIVMKKLVKIASSGSGVSLDILEVAVEAASLIVRSIGKRYEMGNKDDDEIRAYRAPTIDACSSLWKDVLGKSESFRGQTSSKLLLNAAVKMADVWTNYIQLGLSLSNDAIDNLVAGTVAMFCSQEIAVNAHSGLRLIDALSQQERQEKILPSLERAFIVNKIPLQSTPTTTVVQTLHQSLVASPPFVAFLSCYARSLVGGVVPKLLIPNTGDSFGTLVNSLRAQDGLTNESFWRKFDTKLKRRQASVLHERSNRNFSISIGSTSSPLINTELRRTGLRNNRNFCFANTLIQSLLCSEVFTCWLNEQLDFEGPLWELAEIDRKLKNKESDVDISRFLASFPADFNGSSQQDILDFFRVFTQTLDSKSSERVDGLPLYDIMGVQTSKTLTCLSCGQLGQGDDPTTFGLQLSFASKLSEAVDKTFALENIESTCELCQDKGKQMALKIKKLPSILVLYLGQIQGGNILERRHFNMDFDSDSLLNMDQHTINHQEARYRLVSVMAHAAGHYVSYLHDRVWARYSDLDTEKLPALALRDGEIPYAVVLEKKH